MAMPDPFEQNAAGAGDGDQERAARAAKILGAKPLDGLCIELSAGEPEHKPSSRVLKRARRIGMRPVCKRQRIGTRTAEPARPMAQKERVATAWAATRKSQASDVQAVQETNLG